MHGANGAGFRTGRKPAADRDFVRLANLACASAAMLIASLGLAGGLTGHRLVDRAERLLVPMAPSTATVFLILGGLLLLRATGTRLPGRRASSGILLALGAAVLWNLGGRLSGLDVGPLDLAFQHVTAWAGAPHTRMSPATAVLFVLACAASWSLSGRRGGWPAPVPGLGAAGLLGAVVALCGGVFLLGYAFGTPLLYGSGVVPMAQSTALAFLLLGAALVCEAGPEQQPLRMFSGPTTKAKLLRVFVPLAVGLSLAHSLALGLSEAQFGQANALVAAGIAAGTATSVGLAVLLAARRVGRSLELAEAQTLAALGEKTVLLKEVHHRVKNNMQIVSSLLTLQAEYVENPKDRVLFKESWKRIKSMALVHEDLYMAENFSFVDMGNYVPRLVEHLVGGSVPPVRTVYEVEDVRLPITQSVPCGMLLNELGMNALKHAFAQAVEPVLRVALRVEGGTAVLEVEDNGPGLPPGFSLTDGSTFGLLLANSLTEQLRGQLTAENTGHGARFELRFLVESSTLPAPDPPEQDKGLG